MPDGEIAGGVIHIEGTRRTLSPEEILWLERPKVLLNPKSQRIRKAHPNAQICDSTWFHTDVKQQFAAIWWLVGLLEDDDILLSEKGQKMLKSVADQLANLVGYHDWWQRYYAEGRFTPEYVDTALCAPDMKGQIDYFDKLVDYGRDLGKALQNEISCEWPTVAFAKDSINKIDAFLIFADVILHGLKFKPSDKESDTLKEGVKEHTSAIMS